MKCTVRVNLHYSYHKTRFGMKVMIHYLASVNHSQWIYLLSFQIYVLIVLYTHACMYVYMSICACVCARVCMCVSQIMLAIKVFPSYWIIAFATFCCILVFLVILFFFFIEAAYITVYAMAYVRSSVIACSIDQGNTRERFLIEPLDVWEKKKILYFRREGNKVQNGSEVCQSF